MKPLNITRPFLSTAVLTIALLASSFLAKADDNKNESGHKKYHRSEYRDKEPYYAHYSDRDDKGKGHQKHYKKYNQGNDYKAYKKGGRNYFDHPRYGRVYQRFDQKPYVLRHSHGNYYYTNNRFYTYHDGIGYCVCEPPRNVYFQELPFQCTRVYANGREYYRNGDLFFRLSARGFVYVPAPVEFNVSVRF